MATTAEHLNMDERLLGRWSGKGNGVQEAKAQSSATSDDPPKRLARVLGLVRGPIIFMASPYRLSDGFLCA